MRRAREMTDLEVRRLKAEGAYAVGGVAGLQLQIIGESKAWILRVMVGAKRRRMGLGGYPTVTLAMARERARDALDKIEAGIDPIQERQRKRSELIASQKSDLTFDQACRAYIDAHAEEWKNPKHLQQWTNTLAQHASPILGKMLVQDIGQPQVLAVLEPIWKTTTETAKRLRGRIESVIAYADKRAERERPNPARWKNHLDAILPEPSKIAKVEHHAALPIDEVGAFVADLRTRNGIAARALEFVILTAARSGEVRGATWSEIDLDGKVWSIPAERMKMKKAHRVPLSDKAVELLKALPRIEGNDLVFPAPLGGVLSDMTLTAVTRRMNADCVPHGFRSSFRDWASERTNFPHAVAEAALAHAIGNKVEESYRRGDLLSKRAQMMSAWAQFIDKPATKGGDVIPMGKSKRA